MMTSIRIKLHGKTLKSQPATIIKRKKRRRLPPSLNKIEESTTTLIEIRFKLNYKTYWVT